MSKLNKESQRLIDEAFPEGDAFIVTGHYDANDEMKLKAQGAAGTFDLVDSDDIYFCVAGRGPGGRNDIRRVMVLVIDDVGKEIDREAFDCFFPLDTSGAVESSSDSFQYRYRIKGGMDPAEYASLRRAMKSNPIWGAAHNISAAAIYRLPQGTHTKSTRKGWKVREEAWADREYTPEEIWGIVPEAERGVGPAPAGGKSDPVEGEELLRALAAMIPNDRADDWDYFVNVGRAIWGASGGEYPEIYQEWADRWTQGAADAAVTQGRWDSFHDARIGRWWLLREANAADPAGVEAWLLKERKEGGGVFNDGVRHDNVEVPAPTMFTVDDFRSVVNETDFLHVETGQFWKPVAVDAKVMAMGDMKATAWIRRNRYVTNLSWLPGREWIIAGHWMGPEGLTPLAMHSVFNLYRAPKVVPVAGVVDASPWISLVRTLWPDEADEIFLWFAHRVQRPGEKINHALVLGGAPGIGKDTVLAAVRWAVGPDNSKEIMPHHLKSDFNDYMKSVLLVVNEVHDAGELSPWAFNNKCKVIIAGPPDTVTINSKYLKQYVVPNVCGVVMTTNYKETGLHLEADDRRYFVCWSECPEVEEGDEKLGAVWAWMESGGYAHVAAWLRGLDISAFQPKVPPRKTKAFWDIVGMSESPVEQALRARVAALGLPEILRFSDLKGKGVFDDSAEAMRGFMAEAKYHKVIAELLGKVGYRRIHNKTRKDGRWKIGGAPESVYGRKDVSELQLHALATKLENMDGNQSGKS